MSRRKRASMREGPLADLFRSTADDAPADPPELDTARRAIPSDEAPPAAAGREAEEAPVDHRAGARSDRRARRGRASCGRDVAPRRPRSG